MRQFKAAPVFRVTARRVLPGGEVVTLDNSLLFSSLPSACAAAERLQEEYDREGDETARVYVTDTDHIPIYVAGQIRQPAGKRRA